MILHLEAKLLQQRPQACRPHGRRPHQSPALRGPDFNWRAQQCDAFVTGDVGHKQNSGLATLAGQDIFRNNLIALQRKCGGAVIPRIFITRQWGNRDEQSS